eukprot:352375-Chlamydomonas_euryale.AAC.5
MQTGRHRQTDGQTQGMSTPGSTPHGPTPCCGASACLAARGRRPHRRSVRPPARVCICGSGLRCRVGGVWRLREMQLRLESIRRWFARKVDIKWSLVGCKTCTKQAGKWSRSIAAD